MDLQLKNKLAFISGSTAGIAYAIAAALAREGARVVVNGRMQVAVDAAVSKLKTVGNVLAFAGDLSTAEHAERAAKAFPDVEILINNLGIASSTSMC